jgi:hypothetical protein
VTPKDGLCLGDNGSIDHGTVHLHGTTGGGCLHDLTRPPHLIGGWRERSVCSCHLAWVNQELAGEPQLASMCRIGC